MLKILRRKISRLALVLFASAAILAIPSGLNAAKTGIEISPVTYEFEISPGESQTGRLNLRNLDSTPVNYIIEAELFSQVSEEGAPSFQGTTKPEGVTTLIDWIAYESAKEGVLQANGQTDINFTITVPEGAEPGGHYAAIFAKQVLKDADGRTQIGVQSRVGLLILVSVPGDVSKTAKIKSFEYPSFITKGPSNFNLRVENTGSVHFDSSAMVEIKPILGKTQILDLGNHIIIPKNTRLFEAQWGNKYPFGYYKLTAKAMDGDGNPVTVTGTLWALPINIIVPLLILILLLWLLTNYFKSHYSLIKQNEGEKQQQEK